MRKTFASYVAIGDSFTEGVGDELPDGRVRGWADEGLTQPRYWSRDKLHLNAHGHARVAGNVLTALGLPLPPTAGASGDYVELPAQRKAEYWRQYLLPWIGRRLTGRSSGDNREPKSATLQPVVIDGR